MEQHAEQLFFRPETQRDRQQLITWCRERIPLLSTCIGIDPPIEIPQSAIYTEKQSQNDIRNTVIGLENLIYDPNREDNPGYHHAIATNAIIAKDSFLGTRFCLSIWDTQGRLSQQTEYLLHDGEHKRKLVRNIFPDFPGDFVLETTQRFPNQTGATEQPGYLGFLLYPKNTYDPNELHAEKRTADTRFAYQEALSLDHGSFLRIYPEKVPEDDMHVELDQYVFRRTAVNTLDVDERQVQVEKSHGERFFCWVRPNEVRINMCGHLPFSDERIFLVKPVSLFDHSRAFANLCRDLHEEWIPANKLCYELMTDNRGLPIVDVRIGNHLLPVKKLNNEVRGNTVVTNYQTYIRWQFPNPSSTILRFRCNPDAIFFIEDEQFWAPGEPQNDQDLFEN